ncbi:MAG: hypothetical protein IT480_07390 [Gammaproteobacteria bacterium]|nr:hypothetical protein [Gammaproteobacteria bacterium]
MHCAVPAFRRPALAGLAALLLATGAWADGGGAAQTVAAGATWTVTQATQLTSLDIAPGATVAANGGRSLTLTVNGVETALAPGHYVGDVRLTPTEANVVKFGAGMPGGAELTHHFRQAVYLDASGLVEGKSVLSASGKARLANGVLAGARVRSIGENFNGIYVAGGQYTLAAPSVDFTGNGGNDFAGYGAALMSIGKDTTLVVDRARVRTHGAIRTAVIADGGSNLIVKNSDIAARNGVLPADYVSNVSPGKMKDAPWMLGVVGNCRATNLLGNDTNATYINSSIAAEGWGVLSIDSSRNTHLTTINSRITITGTSGYGSYAIGDSLNAFYGSTFNVPDYGVIITGGNAIFGASTPATLQRLNAELKLGLGAKELTSIRQRPTVLRSKRFGVMWHGDGSVKVGDDTVFDTGLTSFLVKGASAKISLDGTGGAKLRAGNGVIVQVIDNDDPGPGMVDGVMVNNGVYHEPTTAAEKIPDFDVTQAHATDVVTTLTGITLAGDFYNAIRGGATTGGAPEGMGTLPGGPGGGAPSGPGGPPGGGPGAGEGGPPPGMMMGGPKPASRNLIVKLANSQLSGVISASTAKHAKDAIGAADYKLLGVVTNTPAAAINNGALVELDHSTWTVTDTSYLTSLTIGADSRVVAPKGRALVLKVNGQVQPLTAGTYRGNVVLEVSPG